MTKAMQLVIAFVVAPVVLMAATIAWTVHANGSAEADAQAFCAAIHPGDDVADHLARADRDGGPTRVSPGDQVVGFFFQGGVFNGALCRVTVADGKVASAEFEVLED